MNEYQTVDYEDKYFTLLKVYKDEVLLHEETRKRGLQQTRHYLITEAQLKSELDEARELIDKLLYGEKPVLSSE